MITGGAGFIGSHLVHFLLAHDPDCRIVTVDALTYAANLDWLASLQGNDRHILVRADIRDRGHMEALLRTHDISDVFHLAAETHVDHSIRQADVFVSTNVLGTQALLDAARTVWQVGKPDGPDSRHRFVHVSTDEVYGVPDRDQAFSEDMPLLPNNTYAASKAAADLLVRAAFKTHGLPVLVTRSSNNYGPWQLPDKLIPRVIDRALRGLPIPVYGDGRQVRDWLHVVDHCAALVAVFNQGQPGEAYNIGGGNVRANIRLVRQILKRLGLPDSQIAFVADRPGHDVRYRVSTEKIQQACGWAPTFSFQQGLLATIDWYRDHEDWLRRFKPA